MDRGAWRATVYGVAKESDLATKTSKAANKSNEIKQNQIKHQPEGANLLLKGDFMRN